MKTSFIQHSWKLPSLLLLCGACGSTPADDSGAETGGTNGAEDGGTSTGGVTGSGGASSGGATSSGGASVGDGGTTQGSGGGDTGSGGGGEPITCPSTALPPGDTTRTITVGGTQRSYVLHVPAAYDGSSPTPLVVDFHPLGGSGPGERSSSPYPAQTDPEGVIMAFPSGLSGPSGGAWNVGACCVRGADDVAFARALVADVAESACIDPKRVYAVGFSMGGGMSHYLACHAADLFAAVAPAAFDLLEENVGECDPERPISVISFRGDQDNVVPYSGGRSSVVSGMPINFLGAQKTLEAWGRINGCTGSPTATGQAGCQGYSNCEGGVDVILCTQNGGHIPGNANVAWPILKKHTLP